MKSLHQLNCVHPEMMLMATFFLSCFCVLTQHHVVQYITCVLILYAAFSSPETVSTDGVLICNTSDSPWSRRLDGVQTDTRVDGVFIYLEIDFSAWCRWWLCACLVRSSMSTSMASCSTCSSSLISSNCTSSSFRL